MPLSLSSSKVDYLGATVASVLRPFIFLLQSDCNKLNLLRFGH